MKCGLIGKTLKHSYSPKIHSFFGDYSYGLFPIEEDALQGFVKGKSVDAYNVTIPYKKTIIPYLDVVDGLALKIGAVNTVVNKGGKLYGYNTDVLGMKYMLYSNGITINDRTVMILGSGGTSLTAKVLCESEGAKNIVIVSRTGEVNYGNCYDKIDTEVIINTTPVGMYPSSYDSPIDISKFPNLKGVADVIYNPSQTKICFDAKRLGIPAVNGLEMLVAQAKYASELFTGKTISDDKIAVVAKALSLETENITLIGMPGSGKSRIGAELAKLTGKKFIDTDALIVQTAGKTIPDIFADDGEDKFRDYETEALYQAENNRGAIIATGGGIIKRQKNLHALSSNGKVVWIQRDIGDLATSGRPLSKDTDALKKLYQERLPLYQSASDFTVKNVGNPTDVAKEILSLCEF